MISATIKGLDAAIKRLERLNKDNLERKLHEVIDRLTQIGIAVADAKFASVPYAGVRDVSPGAVMWLDDTHAQMFVTGTTVLFLEFGSGMLGYGHEQAEEFGYGPGSWSEGPEGKGHWDQPGGWYYAHGLKSFGNRPARAMYEAGKEMRERLADIAMEVFGT